HQPKDGTVAAVWNLQQQRAVGFLCILRTDRDEVGNKFDLAVFEVRRIAQVDDSCVMRIGDSKREEHAAGDALVSAGLAKPAVAQEIYAVGHFDANYLAIDGSNSERQGQNQNHELLRGGHAAQHSTHRVAVLLVAPTLGSVTETPALTLARPWI